MLPLGHPDRIQIAFDDHRLVNNAGLILPAILAQHLGLPQLVDRYLDLGRAPGRANTGDKIMTLVASALAGGDCIDDAESFSPRRRTRFYGGTWISPNSFPSYPRGPSTSPGQTRSGGTLSKVPFPDSTNRFDLTFFRAKPR